MANVLVKNNEMTIQEAREHFLSLPVSEAIIELKKTATDLLKEIDKISKYQDEKSKKMFDAYISQLKICQNLSESQELTVEERGRYFDLSMDLLGRMEVHEEKDNQRKENDKKRKWVAFGLTIVGIVGTIGATLIASQNSKK